MPGYTSTWNPGITSSTPSSTSTYSGNNGSSQGNQSGHGQGPHWDDDDESPIIPVHEIVNAPIDYNLESEKEDWLGGKKVSTLTNEEIAANTGQTYNPNTGNIESSYNVPEHDAMSISQANYNKYGDNLANWPADAKLQAKQSGFFGAQAEGMLGGVTGLEKDINAQKAAYLKAITEGGESWEPGMEALASLTAQFGGNEELAKMNALGVQEYLKTKFKIGGGETAGWTGDYQGFEDVVTGKAQIKGLENFDFGKFIDQTAGLDWGKDYGALKGDAMGYDPSGVYTWGDVQDDPWLSEAYYGLTTGDPTKIPDHLYDKYLKEILYYGNPPDEGGDERGPYDRRWGWGGGQQYGTFGVDSLADLAKYTWFSESLSDVEAREKERLDEGLGVATMADMEQIYGKEFAAKANPLHDPGFSLEAIQEYGPVYGDLRLWQEAQKA